MNPIWPLHLIILHILVLCPLRVLCQAAPTLTATFTPSDITVYMQEYYYVDIHVQGQDLIAGDELTLQSRSDQIAEPEWNSTYRITDTEVSNSRWQGRMRVVGKFLGRTTVELQVKRGDDSHPITNGNFPVAVLRLQRVIDTLFTASVAVFLSIIFINFGCAMDWPTVKNVIKRPIGPLIGLVGQFLFMPLMTFGLGFLIFPDSPAMRLGMFFVGVSPGGGASNIWTFILKGNLNLSIAMTSISTICSFGLMPAWLFSLGQVVFRNANIVVPYSNIAIFTLGLIIPLGVGLAMQKWTPRLAAFMVRILKGFSTTLLVFVMIIAIVTNLYILQLFSWNILAAGIGIPWLGFTAGYAMGIIFKQPHPDPLTISIETGVTNTGISIFLLRYALGQPEADLATVIPMSVAIMTPFPMVGLFIYQQIKDYIISRNRHKYLMRQDTQTESKSTHQVLPRAWSPFSENLQVKT